MVRVAIVSDEISMDFYEAAKIGKEWGIKNFELRFLKSGRVPQISRDEIEAIIRHKETFNVEISALSPGLFQISLRDEEELKKQLEQDIYEAFRLADKLDSKKIIIFGFKKYPREPETNYVQIIHILTRMASLAGKYGFTLLLENLPGTWADTGQNTAKILRDVNVNHLRANWDLANSYMAGEIPYPYGYLTIRHFIDSIHVKDVRENSQGKFEFVPLGEGEIDWQGQIKAVMNSARDVNLTIETHCKPLVENSKMNVSKVKLLIEENQMNENFIVK